jgi:hypothetical protein
LDCSGDTHIVFYGSGRARSFPQTAVFATRTKIGALQQLLQLLTESHAFAAESGGDDFERHVCSILS